MQDYICIRKWLATEPQIRDPGLINNRRSRCWMKNLQKSLVSRQFSDGTIRCKRMELTTVSPLEHRTNVKKSDHIYDGRTQDQFKKSVLYSNNLNIIWDKHKSA